MADKKLIVDEQIDEILERFTHQFTSDLKPVYTRDVTIGAIKKLIENYANQARLDEILKLRYTSEHIYESNITLHKYLYNRLKILNKILGGEK